MNTSPEWPVKVNSCHKRRDRSRSEQLCGIALRVVMGCGGMADGDCCMFRIVSVLRREWVEGVHADRALGLRVNTSPEWPVKVNSSHPPTSKNHSENS